MASDKWTRDATHDLLSSLGYEFDPRQVYVRGKKKYDMFNVIDVVAFNDRRVLAVQYTERYHMNSRRDKVLRWQGLGAWLQHSDFEVYGWRQTEHGLLLTRDIGSLYEGEPSFTRTNGGE